MKTTIFICGPYRGGTIFETKKNIDIAWEYSLAAWEKWNCVITPHLNSQFMDGCFPDEKFLGAYLQLIREYPNIDIGLLPNYFRSSGSIAEIGLALDLSLNFYLAYEGFRLYDGVYVEDNIRQEGGLHS